MLKHHTIYLLALVMALQFFNTTRLLADVDNENSCEYFEYTSDQSTYSWGELITEIEHSFFNLQHIGSKKLFSRILRIRRQQKLPASYNNYEKELRKDIDENTFNLWNASHSLFKNPNSYSIYLNCENSCEKIEIEESLNNFLALQERQLLLFNNVVNHYKALVRRSNNKGYLIKYRLKPILELEADAKKYLSITAKLPKVIYNCSIG